MIWKSDVWSKSKLARLVQTALKSVGWEEKLPIQKMYEVSVLRLAKKIVADDTHIYMQILICYRQADD